MYNKILPILLVIVVIVASVVGYFVYSAYQDYSEGDINNFSKNIIYYEDGKTVLYEGETKDGQPHGQGVQYHKNGAVKFKGEFVDGEIYEGAEYRGGNLFFEGRFQDEMPLIENVRSQEELRAEDDERIKQFQLRDMNPMIGMTREEVLLTKWGKPDDINRTVTAYGKTEQWVYSGYRYLYFEDGILTTIQN